ncbi:MAG: hypothetical protein R3E98_13640 [Gemmatimonadota bacterium]|nr:hypothetical protein [Gemmatimonadota bacterium]
MLRSALRPLVVLSAGVLAGCGAANVELPPPRPLIVHSGARLQPEPERMAEIDTWVRAQNLNIEQDPSFWVISTTALQPVLPWAHLEVLSDDSVRIAYEGGVPDIGLPYQLYAHFHLMERRGELEEWLPEAADETGYPLERAIVKRVADAWLYGRSVFETTPYAALDELIYASENGYLDAFLFTDRPDEFPEARNAWIAEHPNGLEEYRTWFEDTFDRPPPGLRGEETGGAG